MSGWVATLFGESHATHAKGSYLVTVKMLFFITVWTVIGAFFGWAVYNTVELWASRPWRR